MEMTRENAKEINEYMGSIDNAVKRLLEYREKGESVFVDFNGHKLYSCDVTIDSAYMEITGQTKAEYDKAREEWRKEYEARQAKEKAEAQAKIPSWIEQGEKFIYPERMEKWKQCVEARASDLYHGMDLDSALGLMEKLESGATIEEVKEILEQQGHSGASEGMVRNIVFHFSKRGPEFYEGTSSKDLSDRDKKVIEDKKKENTVLDKLHNSKNITSNLLEAMSMTQSWLNFEDLQTVLPPEQYQELLTTVKSDLEQYYAKSNIPDVTQEEIDKEIAEEIERKIFEIGVDDKGGFILQEFAPLSREKLTRPINPNQLDEIKLASVVEKAMQKHLDYDRFHTNRYLKAEQIPETLAFYIEVAKQCQVKNREISKEESETIKEALSYSMGADLHEAWRETRKKENGTYEPRMKKSKDEKWNKEHGTDDVDIANLTFEELPSNWQYENLEAARVAIAQVFDKVIGGGEISEEMIETMSSEVHEAWLKRNDWVYDKEYGNPDQAKPYVDLSEEEKAKDRVQIQEAIQKVQAYVRGEIDINKLNEQYGLVHTKERTPLEQKEAELTELEAEAKTISEAEALIDQQKEGQDIGEE